MIYDFFPKAPNLLCPDSCESWAVVPLLPMGAALFGPDAWHAPVFSIQSQGKAKAPSAGRAVAHSSVTLEPVGKAKTRLSRL